MDTTEKEIHDKVLSILYDGLKTDRHDKYLNKEVEKKYAVKDFYPDIILTKKGTEDVTFIVEVITRATVTEDTLLKHWKPISDLGGTFYLVVPKEGRNQIELQCRKHDIKVRIGTFEIIKDKVQIKFA